jgi:hypothetical protein
MVIRDEDGTGLGRGVDLVLKEWWLTAGDAGEPPALVAAMWFGSACAMERRGESDNDVQVEFKSMTPHYFSSAPTGSADFDGCYPLLSSTSFDWQLRSGGVTGGRHGVRAATVQRFLLQFRKKSGQ